MLRHPFWPQRPDLEGQQSTARLLRVKIREAGLTLRWVSRELGWHQDRLSRVLAGRLPLRMDDVYDILVAISLPPSEFFAELEKARKASRLSALVFPPIDPDDVLGGKEIPTREIRRLLDRLLDKELRPPKEEPEPTADEEDEEKP